jgi:hypothetical protein
MSTFAIMADMECQICEIGESALVNALLVALHKPAL